MSSETFSFDDIDYIPLLTQEIQEGKFKSVDPRFLDAYRRQELREDGWTSGPEIAANMGLASYSYEEFKTKLRVIKGRISELRGKLFELEMIRQYIQSGMVMSMTPSPVNPNRLQYPVDCAAEKKPDRIIILLNSEIRICSWKCYTGGGTSTIKLGIKKRSGILYGPEIREARRLIELGGNPDLIRVVMEGVVGRLERHDDGIIFVPQFFQLDIDPYTCDYSVTIPKAGRTPWPPTPERLTGIKPKQSGK